MGHNGCLHQQSGVFGEAQGEDSDDEAETDEAALASAESWEPDPIDADPSRSARSRRMHDIISMLVGIYGSKELFITEYRCFCNPQPASQGLVIHCVPKMTHKSTGCVQNECIHQNFVPSCHLGCMSVA